MRSRSLLHFSARLLLAAVLLGACGDSGEEPPPLPAPAAGDLCLSPVAHCSDERVALYCEQGRLEEVDCADTCITTSSAYVDGSCVADMGCECELEDPEGCDPSETRCADESSVEICGDDQTTSLVDCDERCETQVPGTMGTCVALNVLTAVCVCE